MKVSCTVRLLHVLQSSVIAVASGNKLYAGKRRRKARITLAHPAGADERDLNVVVGEMPWLVLDLHLHGSRGPSHDAIFEIAHVRQQRRTGGAESEGCVFNNRLARADGLREVEMMIEMVAVFRGRLEDFVSSRAACSEARAFLGDISADTVS